jgi:hypothetical protein
MKPGQAEGYLDLERKFGMARHHTGAVLRNKLSQGLDMQHHAVRDDMDVIGHTADRLVQIRPRGHIHETKRATVRGLALGSIIIHSLIDRPLWPLILDDAVQKSKTNDDLYQLYEQASHYLRRETRPVLHDIVQTNLTTACLEPPYDHVESLGLAWGGVALVLMAEDEGRFQNWAAADVVRGFEDLLGIPEE